MLKLIASIVGGLMIVFAADALFHALASSASSPADLSDPDAMRNMLPASLSEFSWRLS